jgi:hypothetical protein
MARPTSWGSGDKKESGKRDALSSTSPKPPLIPPVPLHYTRFSAHIPCRSKWRHLKRIRHVPTAPVFLSALFWHQHSYPFKRNL